MSNEVVQLMTGVGLAELSHDKLAVFIGILLWAFFWKGLGLWHAAQRGQKWGFIIILFLNTFGILEIVYLLLVLRLRLSEVVGMRRRTEE